HLSRHALAGDQRQTRDRQGNQPTGHRAVEARGPLARDAAVHSPVSLLLALRLGADLLRAQLVVRAHLGREIAPARSERPGRLASTGSGEWTVWGVARKQRGLGAVARSILGHSAKRVGVRCGGGAPRGHGPVPRAGGALG